jgi:hypothetical protein
LAAIAVAGLIVVAVLVLTIVGLYKLARCLVPGFGGAFLSHAIDIGFKRGLRLGFIIGFAICAFVALTILYS